MEWAQSSDSLEHGSTQTLLAPREPNPSRSDQAAAALSGRFAVLERELRHGLLSDLQGEPNHLCVLQYQQHSGHSAFWNWPDTGQQFPQQCLPYLEMNDVNPTAQLLLEEFSGQTPVAVVRRGFAAEQTNAV